MNAQTEDGESLSKDAIQEEVRNFYASNSCKKQGKKVLLETKFAVTGTFTAIYSLLVSILLHVYLFDFLFWVDLHEP